MNNINNQPNQLPKQTNPAPLENKQNPFSIVLLILVCLILGAGMMFAYEHLISQTKQPEALPVPSPAFQQPVVASPNPQTSTAPKYVPGNVLVGFHQGVTQEKAEQIAKEVNATIIKTTLQINLYTFQVKVGEEEKTISALKKYPEVEYAELNGIITIPDCSKGPC